LDPRMATRESQVGSSASASHLRYLAGNPNRAGVTGHLYEHINAEQLLSRNRFRLWDRNAARSHMPVDGRDVLIKLVDSVFFVP
jgi:hypothetical protein